MKNLLRILSLTLVVVLGFTSVACAAPKGSTVQISDKGNKTDNVTFLDTTYDATTSQSISMESKVDSFSLLETTYGAEDKFVYTATVSFDNGVAAGLAFGAEGGSHYWVFNVDRQANRVKLIYFGYFLRL